MSRGNRNLLFALGVIGLVIAFAVAAALLEQTVPFLIRLRLTGQGPNVADVLCAVPTLIAGRRQYLATRARDA